MNAIAHASAMSATGPQLDNRRVLAGVIDLLVLAAGAVVIYIVGLPWLKLTLHLSWTKALAVGVLPFLIGDALKVVAAVAIVRVLQSTASTLFPVLQNRTGDQ